MRKITLMLTLVFLVAACLPSELNQQPNSPALQTAIANTSQAYSQQPTAIITSPSPIETNTEAGLVVESTPTLNSPSLNNLPISTPLYSDPFSRTILFDTNGTYKDIVVDSIPAGESRTFSINAMKGQIMSVSIWRYDGAESYLPKFRIMSADGAILCPAANQQCLFWRGVLPSTQNYFVIFTADPSWAAASFMMRVAINPLGVEKQYFQYKNSATGVALTYSDLFAPTGGFLDGYISTGSYKIQPEFILHLIDAKAFENTNLNATYMTIGSTRDSQITSTCLETNWNGLTEQVVGVENLYGYDVLHSKRDGVASGHLGEEDIYRMLYNKTCYEIIYHIHSVDIGYLASGTVAFDRSAIIQEMNDIFSSFAINK